LDRELNSLKWDIKELGRKKKEADDRIQIDVEQINGKSRGQPKNFY